MRKQSTLPSKLKWTFFIILFTGEECVCRDWHGCIMSQKIVGLEDVQPYKFSECSKADYIDALRMGHGLCLLNKPNEVRFVCWCTYCHPSFQILGSGLPPPLNSFAMLKQCERQNSASA